MTATVRSPVHLGHCGWLLARCRHLRFSTAPLILALAAAIAACAGDPVDEKTEIPEIIEVFACSDYCPGPEEKYMKRVYEGVTDAKECRELGGKLYTYIGWGEHTICEVK